MRPDPSLTPAFSLNLADEAADLTAADPLLAAKPGARPAPPATASAGAGLESGALEDTATDPLGADPPGADHPGAADGAGDGAFVLGPAIDPEELERESQAAQVAAAEAAAAGAAALEQRTFGRATLCAEPAAATAIAKARLKPHMVALKAVAISSLLAGAVWLVTSGPAAPLLFGPPAGGGAAPAAAQAPIALSAPPVADGTTPAAAAAGAEPASDPAAAEAESGGWSVLSLWGSDEAAPTEATPADGDDAALAGGAGDTAPLTPPAVPAEIAQRMAELRAQRVSSLFVRPAVRPLDLESTSLRTGTVADAGDPLAPSPAFESALPADGAQAGPAVAAAPAPAPIAADPLPPLPAPPAPAAASPEAASPDAPILEAPTLEALAPAADANAAPSPEVSAAAVTAAEVTAAEVAGPADTGATPTAPTVNVLKPEQPAPGLAGSLFLDLAPAPVAAETGDNAGASPFPTGPEDVVDAVAGDAGGETPPFPQPAPFPQEPVGELVPHQDDPGHGQDEAALSPTHGHRDATAALVQMAALTVPPTTPAAAAAPPAAATAAPPAVAAPAAAVATAAATGPRVVVIIDDMGVNAAASRATAALPGPLTLAWLPYASGLEAQTRAAAAAGHEMMLHLPMQPLGAQDPGPDALTTDLSEGEIRLRTRAALAAVPGIVAVNNHMGSAVTADAQALRPALEEIALRGLAFIDSRTSPHSVAGKVAAELGVRFAGRDVFLDHDPSPVAVRAALAQLERQARETGLAIAIGHPHNATREALAEWLPTLAAKGITLVPISAVVGPPRPLFAQAGGLDAGLVAAAAQ